MARDLSLEEQHELLRQFIRDEWILQNPSEYTALVKKAGHHQADIRNIVFDIITDGGQTKLAAHLKEKAG